MTTLNQPTAKFIADFIIRYKNNQPPLSEKDKDAIMRNDTEALGKVELGLSAEKLITDACDDPEVRKTIAALAASGILASKMSNDPLSAICATVLAAAILGASAVMDYYQVGDLEGLYAMRSPGTPQ